MEDDRKVFLLRVRRRFPAELWEEKKNDAYWSTFLPQKKKKLMRLMLIFTISSLFPLNCILNYVTYMKFLKPQNLDRH